MENLVKTPKEVRKSTEKQNYSRAKVNFTYIGPFQKFSVYPLRTTLFFVKNIASEIPHLKFKICSKLTWFFEKVLEIPSSFFSFLRSCLGNSVFFLHFQENVLEIPLISKIIFPWNSVLSAPPPIYGRQNLEWPILRGWANTCNDWQSTRWASQAYQRAKQA